VLWLPPKLLFPLYGFKRTTTQCKKDQMRI
jgi:hypothetical protein